MKSLYPENWPQFYTATIDGWKHLLEKDKYKDVIISSLQYLIKTGKVKLNAFVIMSNPAFAGRQACTFYLAGYRRL